MADPLSVAASIIAVIGAIESVSKTLAKIKDIRNAPSEALALNNEVSDLRIVLGDVERYVIKDTYRSHQSPEQLQTLSILLGRASDNLLELDKIIQDRLIEAKSTATHLRVSRYKWAVARPTIERFRQSLKDIKLNIVTQMGVMNTSYQFRIGLTIDEIFAVSSQIRTSQLNQHNTSDRAIHQLDEHSRILSNLLNGQSELRELLQLDRPLAPAADIPGGRQPSAPVISVRAYRNQQQKSPCSPYCRCKCHDIRSFRSPNVLHELVGTLFIGYSGSPVSILQQCTRKNCINQSTVRAYVYYHFPPWFLAKAITVALMMNALAEIQVSLAVRRLVPNGAEVFRLRNMQDINGLKMLFSKGLASPNDSVAIGGDSLLQISVSQLDLEVCEFLLSAGANPLLERFDDGLTAFPLAWEQIFSTTDTAVAGRLRAMFPAGDDEYDELEFSKLHKMVLGLDSSDMAKELVHHKADIDATDSMGMSALSWAARRGDDFAVKLLLEANADANLVNRAGDAVLYLAAQSGSAACTKLLLAANADIHRGEKSYYTALHAAARFSDHGDLIKLLVEAGIHVDVQSVMGGSPLTETTSRDNPITAAKLLDLGADIDFQDNEGDTSLENAVFFHSDNTTQLLLQRGADYSHKDSNGDSILHAAAKSGGTRTLEIFINAELKGIDPFELNRQGKTATQVARERLTKPDGFVEKMHELIIGIDKRNVHIAQTWTQDDDGSTAYPSESVDEGLEDLAAALGIFRDFVRTSYLYCALRTFRWTSHVRNMAQMQLRRNRLLALFLGWGIGIATAYLTYRQTGSSTTILEKQEEMPVI